MVTIDAVRLWALDHERSLGHVVASTGVWGAYVHTACEQLGNFPVTEARPKRICRACRVALKTARPSSGPEERIE